MLALDLSLLLALVVNFYPTNCIVFFPSKDLAHRMKVLFGLHSLNAAELHGNLTQPQVNIGRISAPFILVLWKSLFIIIIAIVRGRRRWQALKRGVSTFCWRRILLPGDWTLRGSRLSSTIRFLLITRNICIALEGRHARGSLGSKLPPNQRMDHAFPLSENRRYPGVISAYMLPICKSGLMLFCPT